MRTPHAAMSPGTAPLTAHGHPGSPDPQQVTTFTMEVPARFRLDLTVWALRRRAHNAVDRFDGQCYRRTLVLGGRPAEAAVHQQDSRRAPLLVVELQGPGSALSAEETVEARRLLVRILGLGADLRGFYRLARADPGLRVLARRFCGMRPPCFPSVFEAVVNAIACQQLSLAVGIHLLNRLAQGYGPVASADPQATPGFPSPESLADASPESLRALGFSRAKARAVTTLAQRVASGEVDLEGLRDAGDDRARQTLLALTGVGRWSAEYTLLRGLARYHVLPGDDVGARNTLRRRFALPAGAGYGEVAELSRAWWPYGGLVYFHLLLDGLATSGQLAPAIPGTTGPRASGEAAAPARAGRAGPSTSDREATPLARYSGRC
jgi:DNA-3-methyladenine glycosylase II